MPDLPSISGKEAIKVFGRLGFAAVRQRGRTLRGAIKQAGLSVDEFLGEYKK